MSTVPDHHHFEQRVHWPLFGKGATAYEFQWRRLGVRVAHLTGEHWGAWWATPWRRVSLQWFGPGPDYSADPVRPAQVSPSDRLKQLRAAMRELPAKAAAYCASAQSKRDGLCLALFVLACVAYAFFVWGFVGGTPMRVQLSLAFSGSLLFSLWYEFEWRDLRGSLIRMTAITLSLVCAAALAPHVRAQVFQMVADARDNPVVLKAFTAEGLALLSNPLAGFGGSFGCSVVFARLIGFYVFTRSLSRVLRHDASVYACPHCQKAIPR